VLPRAEAGRSALRRGRHTRGAGYGGGHRRDDEAHELGVRRRARDGHRDLRGRCRVRRAGSRAHAARAGTGMIIRRLLIANRGEIAARIIRTCRRLGIETVLAASDADLESVPARLADRTIRIGPAPSARSYLDIAAVVRAAKA